MKEVLADWKLLLGLGAGSILALGLVVFAFMRPNVDPEEAERKRRLHLNLIGRIAEGQVVELNQEPPAPAPAHRGLLPTRSRPMPDMRPRCMVSYSYSISGVTYHTAQDVTGLESQVRFERLMAGQQASVKYDPANPSDSILVADDWSGLR
ncbi:MAG TPA: DUF3592 domain-containing protein [Candidatus Eremiobacteraceae bacterium]|nr:DUF3592 domain-containing protein [Candidatus Eremiobacteraceae bacterium]